MLEDRAKLLLKTLVERYIADGQPVGTVYVAVSTPETELVVPLLFAGTRAEIRAASVGEAVTAVGRALGL